MLDFVFLGVLTLGIIFVLISVLFDDKPFWSILGGILSSVIFFTLGAESVNIEQAYTMYNATSGNIESGINTVLSATAPGLAYMMMMVGLIMGLFFIFRMIQSYLELAAGKA